MHAIRDLKNVSIDSALRLNFRLNMQSTSKPRHNLQDITCWGLVPLESCQLQIPQVISCSMHKPSSHQLHNYYVSSLLDPNMYVSMAAGFSLNHQVNCMHVATCMCGCWIRLSPQVINYMICVMAAGSKQLASLYTRM